MNLSLSTNDTVCKAVNETLDHFNIFDDREVAKSNLLKLHKISSGVRWNSTDHRVVAISNMLRYFKSRLQSYGV